MHLASDSDDEALVKTMQSYADAQGVCIKHPKWDWMVGLAHVVTETWDAAPGMCLLRFHESFTY